MSNEVKQTGDKPKRVFPGGAGPGRPKGSQNKTTAAAKDVISKAAEMLGGADRLIEWVREDALNERAFWSTIYPKLLPLKVEGDKDAPLQVQIVRFSDKPKE